MTIHVAIPFALSGIADSAKKIGPKQRANAAPALTTTRRNRAMANRSDITPELCRQLLRYEPETGKLFWCERSPFMFAPGVAGVRVSRTPEHQARNWNVKFAGKEALTTPTNCGGYFYGTLMRMPFKAHRVAWAIFHGKWPDGVIDHINGNGRDNRISNLRDVPQEINCRNFPRRADNKSGTAGIIWYKQTSRRHVRVGKKHIGFFKSMDDAVIARDAARADKGYTGRDVK